MPGIVGVISKSARFGGEELVRQMLGSMLHEPFYLSGTFAASELGIFAGWIALENSFAAAQPLFNETKDLALILSGEIYLAGEAKLSLLQRYEDEGEKFLENLNGLFSGLLIDRRKGCAILFNDRFGFDRIYLAEKEDSIYFASEAKALLRILPELRAFDRDGLVDLLTFGCTIENRTLFRGVALLPAAACWTFEIGSCRKKKYFSPASWEQQPTLSRTEFQGEFDRILVEVTPKYFASESKLAVSLTAGLDTRMLLAARPRSERKIDCYTYEGPTRQTLDAGIAAEIATACDYRHQVLRLGADFFADFPAIADRSAYLTDGTLGPTGAHEIDLSRAAREISPTRLTGVFGGEILRGVSTFHALEFAPALFTAELRDSISQRQRAPKMKKNAVTSAAFEEIPWNIFGSVAACRSQLTFRTPFMDNDLVALAYRLPLDWRHSSEPSASFIRQHDPTLAGIPTDMGQLGTASLPRRLSRRFFAKATFKLDYWANDGMPNWLSSIEPGGDMLNWRPPGLRRHKYLCYRRWFRYELRDYIRDRLASPALRESGIFDETFLGHLGEDHFAGRANYVQEINLVLMIEAVQRLLLQAS